MPNRTFFIDHESQQSIRSMSLPTRSRSDDVTTWSRQRPLIQAQYPSEQEASVRLIKNRASKSSNKIQRRRYARQLATTEKDRVRRRRTHRKRNQSASRIQDFQEVFECPPNSDTPADISKAVTDDLQTCLKHILPPWPTAMTPMERFIALGPDEDHWCVDSRSKPGKNGLHLGNQEFARQRIQIAIKLAADTTILRHRVAVPGLSDSGTTHIADDNETSWLNLEEDSVISCSGNSCGEEAKNISRPATAIPV